MRLFEWLGRVAALPMFLRRIYSHVANADITTEVLHLLSRLEGDPDDFVLDATIRHGHGDRKALAREQQKKIALGHKPDDHDQGQQMM